VQPIGKLWAKAVICSAGRPAFVVDLPAGAFGDRRGEFGIRRSELHPRLFGFGSAVDSDSFRPELDQVVPDVDSFARGGCSKPFTLRGSRSKTLTLT
jgi:hypothetical protein